MTRWVTPVAEIVAEAEQALKNLGAVLRAAGMSYADAAMVTVFLTDIDDYAAVNALYATYFATDPPARQMVAVAALPRSASVEISLVAMRSLIRYLPGSASKGGEGRETQQGTNPCRLSESRESRGWSSSRRRALRGRRSTIARTVSPASSAARRAAVPATAAPVPCGKIPRNRSVVVPITRMGEETPSGGLLLPQEAKRGL